MHLSFAFRQSMRTYFFEVQEVEKPYLSSKLGVVQFADRLQDVSMDQYQDAEVISVFVHSRLDAETLAALPSLKRILTRSTGTDHIDMSYCRGRGITVCNVPSYGEHTVAEYAFAMVLAAFRKVHEAHLRSVQSNVSQEGLMGTDLYGKTLGVIGTGKIGEHMIRIANGFGMQVLAYDVQENPACSAMQNCRYVTREELYAASDVVSLHIPLTEETAHFVDAVAFSQMKRGVVLINTARGGVVDSQALLDALDQNIVAFACLDVIEGEELLRDEHVTVQNGVAKGPQDFDLLALDARLIHHRRVLYTPHIAYYTKEAIGRIMEETIKNLS